MTDQLSNLEQGLPPAPHLTERDVQPEIIGSPEENLRAAEEVIGIVETAPGDDSVGERVAEIAREASKRASQESTPEAHDEAVVLGDAEAIAVLAEQDPAHKAAIGLAESPELPDVVGDLVSVDPSEQAATFLTKEIDEALAAEQAEAPKLPRPVSSAAFLLQETWNPEGGGLRLKKLEYAVKDPEPLLLRLQNLGEPSPTEKFKVSAASIRYLKSLGMALYAPVEAGSVGAEQYDKTQRDRRFFRRSDTGGAGNAESYASQLFCGASNPELQRFVANQLEGKTIVNLGGGNAKIAKELRDDFNVNINMTNVEPYPSEASLNNPEADPLNISNPAELDFVEKSGISPHSVDEVLAVFSVPAYLGTVEEVRTLFENVKTILKPGGHARFSHLGIVGAQEGDARVGAIVSALELAAGQGYTVEIVKTNIINLILTAPEDTYHDMLDKDAV